ncbi:MAG: alkaline phosphatase family protein [Candidatus Dormibacteria bacterium]
MTATRLVVVAVAACMAAACGSAGSSVSEPATQPAPSVSATSPGTTPVTHAVPHVMVIVEENRGYAATLGSCFADPYLCSLASSYASLTSWYAIAHPSAPNYLALESGGAQGISSDCTPDGGGCGPFQSLDLGAELSSAGIPWVAYMESMPSPCDRVGGSGDYAEKHNPFMYFGAERGNACAAHLVPYPGAGSMSATLDSSAPPDFVWITPNLAHDMHDGSVAQGDAWLHANLLAVLSSAWFADHGTVIITMDENDASPSGSCCGNAAGGRVPMIVVSANARGRGAIVTRGDHYTTLRTIESAFGLRLLGNAAAAPGDFSALLG